MVNKSLSETELLKFGTIGNLSQKAEALLNEQKSNWELLQANFIGLRKVRTKLFTLDNFNVKVQFNPTRITSTAAKVDAKSIAERKCFLCLENLPAPQKGILYKNDYIILCNPFPIFEQHLTIPNINHIPQNIEKHILDMLDLTFDLKDNFFVFYNGPKCGASAPDHFHFQAGIKNMVPIESDYKNLVNKNGRIISQTSNAKVILIENNVRPFISIESNDKKIINETLIKILDFLKTLTDTTEEPLVNILSYFENKIWKVIIFPREKHRPKQYFAENKSKLIISPASVDMAGLLVTPREEDFEKVSKEDIESIYKQVSVNNKLLKEIKI